MKLPEPTVARFPVKIGRICSALRPVLISADHAQNWLLNVALNSFTQLASVSLEIFHSWTP